MIDVMTSTIVEVVSDPIWAYLMTGAVGLAGIGGTLWQANRARKSEAELLQRNISAENERSQLAEKRRIYAHFHALCDPMLWAAIQHRIARERQVPRPSMSERSQCLMRRVALCSRHMPS